MFDWWGRRRWNDCHLPGATGNRVAPGGGSAHAASRTDLERLSNDRPFSGRLLRDLSVGIQDHCDGFLEIGARFFQGRALSVGAWQLFDKANVPLGHFAKDGGKLEVHNAMIRLGRHEA